MFTIHRRKSDYLRIVIIVAVLAYQLFAVSATAFQTRNFSQSQQEFNARTEIRVGELERYRDTVDDLQLERRLTTLETQVNSIDRTVTGTLAGVGILLSNLVWQVISATRQRKNSVV